MIYAAIVLSNTAVVRRADYGLTDEEFSLGARIVNTTMTNQLLLQNYLTHDMNLDVLSSEDWNAMIRGDDYGADRFINTSFVKPDKWNRKLPFVDGMTNYGDATGMGTMTKKI